MKVLVTDRKDKTLYCLDASEILYNPNNKQVWLRGYGSGCSEICITDLEADAGNGIVKGFFEYPNLDLRKYEAYVNEVPPSKEDSEKIVPKKDMERYKHKSIYKSNFIE